MKNKLINNSSTMIFMIVALCFIIWCMIATIYKEGITIQKQAETIEIQKIKIRKLEKTPQWLINAYDKCSSQLSIEEILRECIAFEIKDLDH